MTRSKAEPQAIHELTRLYEAWLRQQTKVVESDLREKHERMRESPFPFLRATYYAWAVLWPIAMPELARAPKVTAVGDLHMENFGTWRDAEGRLAWGVNDFDEAAVLPYTSDLVRLATSASLAYETAKLRAPGAALAEAFLEAYVARLRKGGRPVILAERNARIGDAVVSGLLRPRSFWKEQMPDADTTPGSVPSRCRVELQRALPPGTTEVCIRPRVAGVGSLGRPRFVAIGQWNGGLVAREAKALVPSGALWAANPSRRRPSSKAFEHLLRASIRSPDPFLHRASGWVVRRLAPDSNKIEIASLGRGLELELAGLMGREVANVHLATPGATGAILADLSQRPSAWLVKAARAMADLTEDMHRRWRKGERS